MSHIFFTSAAYFRYILHSGTRHSVHSPFVYTLVDEVIRNKKENPAFAKIKKIRFKQLQNTQRIEITDFGSGADFNDFSLRFESVSSIVRKSAVNAKYGKLLFRLIEYFKPQTIIELGTSVGLSTLYLALAKKDAKIYTIEGCTAKSERAAAGFKLLQLTNIEQHIGRFDIVLPDLIKQVENLDFAFIDGNHTYEATIANFEKLLKIAHNDTVFVFDDIHWSSGMEKAWSEIINHEQVTICIDLFRMGIVFLRKELSRQQFVIRY